MADQQHLKLLLRGVDGWNEWRRDSPDIYPDLSEAQLSRADLHRVDFSLAELHTANLQGVDLHQADLRRANLIAADLFNADLHEANLSGASLQGANLSNANLSYANLSETDLKGTLLVGADLHGADLTGAYLAGTNLNRANLAECCIYGICAWNVQLQDAHQSNLVISSPAEPTTRVRSVELAQLISFLQHTHSLQRVFHIYSSRIVILLERGDRTAKGTSVLNAIGEALTQMEYVPVSSDLTYIPVDLSLPLEAVEHLRTLAGLSRFIIIDVTNLIPPEFDALILSLPHVPIQPILNTSKNDSFQPETFFQDYPWVLPISRYTDQASLLTSFKEQVIGPAERKAQELANR